MFEPRRHKGTEVYQRKIFDLCAFYDGISIKLCHRIHARNTYGIIHKTPAAACATGIDLASRQEVDGDCLKPKTSKVHLRKPLTSYFFSVGDFFCCFLLSCCFFCLPTFFGLLSPIIKPPSARQLGERLAGRRVCSAGVVIPA